MIAKRGQHVALRDHAHVDQDLAELIAALLLEFQGAIEIFGLDLAALDQHLAEPQITRTEHFPGFGIGLRGRDGGHYRSSVSTLPAAAAARSARIMTCEGMPVVSSHGP